MRMLRGPNWSVGVPDDWIDRPSTGQHTVATAAGPGPTLSIGVVVVVIPFEGDLANLQEMIAVELPRQHLTEIAHRASHAGELAGMDMESAREEETHSHITAIAAESPRHGLLVTCGGTDARFAALEAMCADLLGTLRVGAGALSVAANRRMITAGDWSFDVPSEMVETQESAESRVFRPRPGRADALPDVTVTVVDRPATGDYVRDLVARLSRMPDERVLGQRDMHLGAVTAVRLELAETTRPRSFYQWQRFVAHRDTAVAVACFAVPDMTAEQRRVCETILDTLRVE